jgi:hypothetical protein
MGGRLVTQIPNSEVNRVLLGDPQTHEWADTVDLPAREAGIGDRRLGGPKLQPEVVWLLDPFAREGRLTDADYAGLIFERRHVITEFALDSAPDSNTRVVVSAGMSPVG